jgi:hypothetical protein
MGEMTAQNTASAALPVGSLITIRLCVRFVTALSPRQKASPAREKKPPVIARVMAFWRNDLLQITLLTELIPDGCETQTP